MIPLTKVATVHWSVESGAKLRLLRQAKGYTSEELAEAVKRVDPDVAISKSFVSKLETTGTTRRIAETINSLLARALCEVLECTIADLLCLPYQIEIEMEVDDNS